MKKIIMIFIISGFAININAKLWRVNNISGIDADFSSFIAAQTSVSAFDTLYFEGSTVSYGDITLSKPLVIIGPGYFLNENPQTQSSAITTKFGKVIINSGGQGSIITGVNIQSSLTINESNISIIRCLLNGMVTLNSSSFSIGSIFISCNYMTNSIASMGSNSISGVLICNNHIGSNSFSYVSIGFDTNVSGEIKNNIFDGDIFVSNFKISNNIVYGSVKRNNNTFYNNIGNGNQFPSENNNLNNIIMTDVFKGSTGYSTDGQWKLKEYSPALGAGSDGSDCGMFGGSSPYVLSGLPSIPSIYEIIIPATGDNINGIDVIIKAKAH